MDDRELLRHYVSGDGEAFGELVRRHRDWVYAVCARRLGDEGLAEDATQVVFLALAREAGKVARHPRVLGWLHRVSRYTAIKIQRDRERRERREREVGVMGANEDVLEDWEAMRGVIEQAMDRLSAGEREAVLLRFYRQLPHAEVGRAMGISEEAAKKRVNRALERLRGMVGAHGVGVTGAGIGAALLGHAVVRVPTAQGGELGRVGAGGTGVKAEALTKGVLQMMKREKLTMAAVWTAAVLVGMSAVLVPLVRGAGSGEAAATAPSVNAEAPGAVASLPKQWHFSPDAARGEVDLTDPVAERGVVYFGDSTGKVRAVDPQQDKVLWEGTVEGRVESLVLDEKQVYVAGSKGVEVLQKGTGEAVWHKNFKDGTGNCAVIAASNRLFVGGEDGVLYALDRNTGEEKWTHSLLDENVVSSDRARLGGPARPTGISTDGTLVYQSVFDQSRVVACDAATGEQRWSFVAKGWIFGAAAFDEKNIFVGSQDGYLYRVAKDSGEMVWKFKTEGRIESTPLVAGGLVFFPSCDGSFYAVSAATGELSWKFDVDRTEAKGGKAIYSKPLICRDAVWFGAGEGHVYGLNPATGELRFKFCPSEESELDSSLAANESHLFVTTRQKNGHNSLEGLPSGENAIFAFVLDPAE